MFGLVWKNISCFFDNFSLIFSIRFWWFISIVNLILEELMKVCCIEEDLRIWDIGEFV